MILIVEGPDGAGKTTLCEQLGDRLNCPVYKPVGAPLTTGMSTVESQGHDRGTIGVLRKIAHRVDMVLDRSFPSEMVYSSLFEREFDEVQVWNLDTAVSFVPHMAVLVTFDDPDSGWDSVRKRGTVEDLDESQWKSIWYGYERYVSESSMEWVVLDGHLPTELHIERVMHEISYVRNSKDRVFMEMARAAATRSTCLSRRVGSVLVSRTGHVIATGYNGAPRGFPHPTKCDRLRCGSESGCDLDQCEDVHAEENAIIQAALGGSDPTGSTMYTTSSPCVRCARMMINAGVIRTVYEKPYDDEAIDLLLRASIALKEMA